MIINQNLAQQTAEYLLQINAIKLNRKNPFIWASGWKSPIYCDNRVALSYPDIRTFLSKSIANEIKTKFDSNITIAGVETGAIGMGMLVAQELNLPFVYVRPEAKKHGRQNQIEGALKPNEKVVVIEDLISTGMSSLNAVDALEKAGATILSMYALFTYGFEKAKKAFDEASVELHTLCNYDCLLPVALEANKISEIESENLKTWRKDPANWSPAKH